MTTKIVPVILCGGAGTRLWPVSREDLPKPFVALFGGRSLFATTLDRIVDSSCWAEPIVVAHAEHRVSVAEGLGEVGLQGTILLEPARRDTAGAIAAAAAFLSADRSDAMMMVLPADHVIPESDQIGQLAGRGLAAAAAGRIVAFGIRPSQPETAFGYIRPDGEAEAWGEARRVADFVEKPDCEAAAACLGAGYLWNSGMFMMAAAAGLAEIARFQPAIAKAAREAVADARRDSDFLWLSSKAWAPMPAIAFDRAVMEKTDRAAVVEADLEWSDVGNWRSVWQMSEKDADGNVAVGSVRLHDSRRTYARSQGPLIGAIGVDDLAIIADDDGVLVASLERAGDIKVVVDDLKGSNSSMDLRHRRIDKPWGYYETLHFGERHQVKRIWVKPGARLSLQKHRHRAEHWVVVTGTALVTRGDLTEMVAENQMAYIAPGMTHRLANPGTTALEVIEVQSGDYLGEDDIVRLEDDYGRKGDASMLPRNA